MPSTWHLSSRRCDSSASNVDFHEGEEVPACTPLETAVTWEPRRCPEHGRRRFGQLLDWFRSALGLRMTHLSALCCRVRKFVPPKPYLLPRLLGRQRCPALVAISCQRPFQAGSPEEGIVHKPCFLFSNFYPLIHDLCCAGERALKHEGGMHSQVKVARLSRGCR